MKSYLEADNEEIPNRLWHQKFQYCVHNSRPLNQILSQLSPEIIII
jgi:hypothetical protein